jgi:hypothetical protein
MLFPKKLPEPLPACTGYGRMLQRLLQNRFTWSDLVRSTMPPRDPDGYNGDDDEDEDDDEEEQEDREPAVIREPDEDE